MPFPTTCTDPDQIILSRAENPGTAAEEVDFLEMHTVAKSVTYLNEGAEAVVSILESMLAGYMIRELQPQSCLRFVTVQGLRYRKGLFQSTQLRLRSLEKRMSNIVNLVSVFLTHVIRADMTTSRLI